MGDKILFPSCSYLLTWALFLFNISLSGAVAKAMTAKTVTARLWTWLQALAPIARPPESLAPPPLHPRSFSFWLPQLLFGGRKKTASVFGKQLPLQFEIKVKEGGWRLLRAAFAYSLEHPPSHFSLPLPFNKTRRVSYCRREKLALSTFLSQFNTAARGAWVEGGCALQFFAMHSTWLSERMGRRGCVRKEMFELNCWYSHPKLCIKNLNTLPNFK